MSEQISEQKYYEILAEQFTPEGLIPEKWKLHVSKVEALGQYNEDETLPYVQTILNLTKYMLYVNHPDDILTDPKTKAFFQNEFFARVVEQLILTKSFRNQQLYTVSDQVIKNIALIAFKYIDENNVKVAEALKLATEADQYYFRNSAANLCTLNWNVHKAQPQSEQYQKWLKNLKAGDEIDALKLEIKITQYKSCKRVQWKPAIIENIFDNYVKVIFPYDDEKSDVSYRLADNEIQPRGTYTKEDMEWRNNLKVGDELDVCDTSLIWYRSTILKIEESTLSAEENPKLIVDRKIKNLYIAYRYYREDGIKTEMDTDRKYFGWYSKYDEWINFNSCRIKPAGTMSDILTDQNNLNDSDWLDDTNDLAYRIGQGYPKFVIRYDPSNVGKLGQNLTILETLQEIDRNNYFEYLIKKIEDKENFIKIDCLCYYVQFIQKVQIYFHRDFARSYIPRFQTAVFNNIYQSSALNIRNFKKEIIDKIADGFLDILKRILNIEERKNLINRFQYKVAVLCFSSEFLERKIQGLKQLQEILRTYRFKKNSQPIFKWIKEDQIFEILYTQNNANLITRSSDMIKFMLNEDLLSLENLELIWEGTIKKNDVIKLAIYKLLSDVAFNFKNEHTEFLVNKITSIKPDQAIIQDLDLLFEIIKFNPADDDQYFDLQFNFVWNILQTQSDLTETAITKFTQLITQQRAQDPTKKQEYIGMCIDNIQKDISSLAMIKIVNQIISNLNNYQSVYNKYTLDHAIQYIFVERDIVSVIVQNLELFKSKLKKKVNDQNNITEKELDLILKDTKYTYVKHINQRVLFLNSIFSGLEKEQGLNFQIIAQIWDEIVVKSLIDKEKDTLYKWFSQISAQQELPITIEDMVKLFDEKMSQQEALKTITLEGFKCYQNVFCVINLKLGHLEKNVQSIIPVTSTNQVTNYQGQNAPGIIRFSTSNNGNTSDDKPQSNDEFQYKCCVPPSELHGVDLLWDLILLNNNELVVEQALEFFIKFNSNFSANLQDRAEELRKDYLKQAYQHLETCITQNKEESQKVRCIQIIASILDESEKKGNGKLKSLTSLIKGEQITLNITNEFNLYNFNLPRKYQVRVYLNSTMLEVAKQVGLGVRAWSGEIKLIINDGNKEIKPKDNGKTIAEMRIKNGQQLTVQKNENTPIVPKAQLILPDKSMNPKASKIFHSWYLNFSKNGQMNHDQCAAFIQSCTGQPCKGDDQRVKNVFNQYDSDKDGKLTPEDFQQFYYCACRDRDQVVWANLQSHNYRQDLLKFDEVQDEIIDVQTLPRFVLSQDDKFFNMVFKLLDTEGITSIETWNLVSRLPPSPIIFQKILKLENIRNNTGDWNELLNENHFYKLLYSLYVIEFLLEQGFNKEEEINNNNDQNDQKNYNIMSDPEVQKQISKWTTEFVTLGGFDHLLKIFQKLKSQNITEQDNTSKQIISLILKITLNYLIPTFATTNKSIYKSMTLARLEEVPLTSILNYLREQDPEYQKQQQQQQLSKLNSDIKKQVEDEEDSDKEDDLLTDINQFSSDNLELIKQESYDIELSAQQKELQKTEESKEFQQLVSMLEQGINQTILSKFQFEEQIQHLSGLAYQILTNQQKVPESEDRAIIQNCITIIAAILLQDFKYLEYFIDKVPNSIDLMLTGIFCQSSQNIRKIFNHVFFALCYETKKQGNIYFTKTILNALIQNIPTFQQTTRQNCTQYFELVCTIIDSAFEDHDNENSQKVLDFNIISEQVCQSIKNHKSQEKRTYATPDKILLGLINLLDKIINAKPELKQILGDVNGTNMVNEIFSKCLFDTNKFSDISEEEMQNYDANYVKCKSQESRQAAYNILLSFCQDCPQNLQILIDNGFLPLLNNAPKQYGFYYYYKDECRSREGLCGIKNLGCICYMNSMIQQFFMTPSFRNAVLMADDKKEPDWKEDKKIKGRIDDNLIHQLQNMFGFLSYSDRMDYNPNKFCYSFKDFDGNPVNVSIQQDAQEFLNMAFDKIEFGLKETPFKYILDDVYGGKTCNQLICTTCGNVINREEKFMNLSLEVKNTPTIYASLEKFTAGEIINEYQCTPCNKKVDITKRSCLSELPNVLIVHLQRIIFDLDYLQNVKVNSKFEFPNELNLEPYTKEGLEWRDKLKALEENKELSEEQINEAKQELKPYLQNTQDYYEYKLAGVVVHIGTAEFGHYYSYIDINRDEKDLKNLNPNEQSWLEFNDSKIRDFSIKQVESECFGGITNDNENDQWSWFKRDNSKNAYMLVYEKKLKHPLRMVYKTEDELLSHLNEIKLNYQPSWKQEQKQIENQENQEEQKNNELIVNVPYYDMCNSNYNNPKTFKEVWEDNQIFMYERNIHGKQLATFIQDISLQTQVPQDESLYTKGYYNDWQKLSEKDRDGYKSAIGLISSTIFEIFSKQYDNSQIHDLQERLFSFIKMVPDYAYQFFHSFILSRTDQILAQLTTLNDKDFRQCLGKLLTNLVNIIVKFENFTLSQLNVYNLSQQDPNNNQVKKEGNMIKFLQQAIQCLPREVYRHSLKCLHYFNFWYEFMMGGEAQMNFMKQEMMLARLIDFILTPQKSPIKIFEQPQQIQTQYGGYLKLQINHPEPIINIIYQLIISSKCPSYPNLNPALPDKKEQQVSDLNVYDKKCIYNFNFWYFLFEYNNNKSSKLFQKDMFGIIGHLIELLAYENQYLSEIISIVVLQSLGQSNSDQNDGILNGAQHLLRINDSYTQDRIKWLVGIPSLQFSPVNQTFHFGMYKQQMADENHISFPSPLSVEYGETLLQVVCGNKKNNTTVSLNAIKYILYAIQDSKQVLEYFVKLPSPQYNNAKMIDFLVSILKQQDQDLQTTRYMYAYQKQQQVDELKQIFSETIPLFQYYIQLNKDKVNEIYAKNNLKLPRQTEEENEQEQQDQEQQNIDNSKNQDSTQETQDQTNQNTTEQDPILNLQVNDNKIQVVKPQDPLIQAEFYQQYLIGKTHSQNIINETVITYPEDYVSQQGGENYFKILEYESQTYITNSKPTGSSNLVIPKNIVRGQYILQAQIDQDDKKWTNFFKKSDIRSIRNQQQYNDDSSDDNDADEEQNTQKQQQKEFIDFLQSDKNDQDFSIKNTVKHFVAVNQSSEFIYVIVDFKFDDSQFVNQNIPKQITFTLNPNSQKDDRKVILAFNKIIPELDWTEYTYTVKYRIVRSNRQRQYNDWPLVYLSDLTEYDLGVFQ